MVQKQHQLEHIILEFCAVFSHQDVMSITTQEIIRLCEALPAEKQDEIADFARFLLARQEDEAWEPRLASAQPLPAFSRAVVSPCFLFGSTLTEQWSEVVQRVAGDARRWLRSFEPSHEDGGVAANDAC